VRIRVQKPPKPGSFKKLLQFLKKGLLFLRRYGNIIKLISAKTEYGRLAQLVEHLLDVQEVTGSSPVPSTTIPRPFGLGIFLWWTVQDSNSTATPQAGQSKPQWGFD
jgi:hypothetical protein